MKANSKSRLFRTLLLVSLSLTLALVGCEKSNKASTEAPAPEAKNSQVASAAAQPVAENSLAGAAGTFAVDPVHSVVLFRAKHMEVSYFIGTFTKVSGSLTLDADPAKSKVSLTVDATSVFTADKKRDDHIKSPDFLNAAQFPTIAFVSSSVKALGESKYEVSGELELHGVKRPVTGTFEHVGFGPNMMDPKQVITGFTGDITIKRSEFGITTMVGPVGDEIVLTISVEAGRAK